MKSSIKPANSKPKKVTFIDYPAGRPSEGYDEKSRPTESEILILTKDEIQKLEGQTLSAYPKTPIAVNVKELDEEYKNPQIHFTVSADPVDFDITYSDNPIQRKLEKYNSMVFLIANDSAGSPAENSQVLLFLKSQCSRQDLEDAYNNLVMEKPAYGTEMSVSLTVLKSLLLDQSIIFTENEFYQIEKAWRLLFQLRCGHLYTPQVHQKNRERLQYLDSQFNLSPRSSRSLLSALTGSPVRTSGDAYALLVRQIDGLLAQDSCPEDFSVFYDLISQRDFNNALFMLCLEDVKRALPFAKILLDAKSLLKLNMQEINETFICVAQCIEEHGDRSLYDLFVAAGADENSRNEDFSAKEYLEQAFNKHVNFKI